MQLRPHFTILRVRNLKKQNNPSLIAYGNANDNLRSNSRWTIETVNESVVSIYPVNYRLCIAWVRAQISGVRWN
jgi:hypothetical protein